MENGMRLREKLIQAGLAESLPGVLEFLKENREVTAPRMQREFRMGYSSAIRMLAKLESMGILEQDAERPMVYRRVVTAERLQEYGDIIKESDAL